MTCYTDHKIIYQMATNAPLQALVQPPVPYNDFGEPDPRCGRDLGGLPQEHAALTDLRNAVLDERRAMPTPKEIRETGATLDQQIWEVWENCHQNRIELDRSKKLEELSPIRRAVVMHWRKTFVDIDVVTTRGVAIATSKDLCALICEAWKDILKVEREERT